MTETSPADPRLAAQTHLREGRFSKAADLYGQLIAAEPHAPDLRYGLGAALSAMGDAEGALDAWSTARVFHGLALLRELGVDMERFAADPAYAAETGRGLAANGLPGVAGAALARAVEGLGPERGLVADYAVSLLHQGAVEEACEALHLAGEDDEAALAPLRMAAHALADDNGLRRALAARQAGAALEAGVAPLDIPPPAPPAGRALRIGYLPGAAPIDMRYLAVIARHDPAHITPLLLVERPEDAPEGFAAQAIGGLSDSEAAQAIAAMGLDVLVDLSGPAGGRMGVFAHRPAPAQAMWNGDLHSSGLSRVDAKLMPEGAAESDAALLFSERRMTLGPVLAPWPAVEIAPREPGRRFTLGAFMAPALMTAPLIGAIAGILNARPEARLMIKHPVMDDPVIQRVLAARFLSHGVARERLDFRGQSGDDLDLFDFETVDLAIDSRPTMGEAQVLTILAYGVPVLCVGEPTTQGNLAVAPIAALGLRELSVVSFKHMAARALELYDHPERLAALRGKIEVAFQTSAYNDARRVAGDLQRCYEILVGEKAAAARAASA
jgi:tetratricopeptide (TPR) repeat protein